MKAIYAVVRCATSGTTLFTTSYGAYAVEFTHLGCSRRVFGQTFIDLETPLFCSLTINQLNYTSDVERERRGECKEGFRKTIVITGYMMEMSFALAVKLKLDFSLESRVKCYDVCYDYIGYADLLDAEHFCHLSPPTVCPQLEVISSSKCRVSLESRSQRLSEAARSWNALQSRCRFVLACTQCVGYESGYRIILRSPANKPRGPEAPVVLLTK